MGGEWEREGNAKIQLIPVTSTSISPADLCIPRQQGMCCRLEWHIISFAFANAPSPMPPARSSSPSTELRARLCCLSSVHTVSKMLIFPTTPAVIPVSPAWSLTMLSFPMLFFSSVPLTDADPSLISLTPPCVCAYHSQNCHSSPVIQKKWCPCASGNLR